MSKFVSKHLKLNYDKNTHLISKHSDTVTIHLFNFFTLPLLWLPTAIHSQFLLLISFSRSPVLAGLWLTRNFPVQWTMNSIFMLLVVQLFLISTTITSIIFKLSYLDPKSSPRSNRSFLVIVLVTLKSNLTQIINYFIIISTDCKREISLFLQGIYWLISYWWLLVRKF